MAATSAFAPLGGRTRVLRSRPHEPAWELWTRSPHPGLRHAVKGLWAGGMAEGSARHRTLPNAEALLMLHVGPAQRAIESSGQAVSQLLATGFVAGFHERPFTIESLHRETYVVTARLRPAGTAALLPAITPAELVGRVLDASDVLGGAAAERLCAQLREARDLGAALDRFEAWLLARLRPERLPPPTTRAASALIARARGTQRVGALGRELGVSARRLNELFQRDLGVPVKRVCRVARFREALERLHAAPARTLAELAPEAGYFDESHLRRDFRELALLTPAEYLAALGDGLDGPDVIAG
jgi:AraC-like DNA-binding protein